MKTHPWLFLSCLFLSSLASAVHADPAFEFIQQLPTGTINWTQGSVNAIGASSNQGSNQNRDNRPEQGREIDQAFQEAVHNLMLTLVRMRMNHQNCISDILHSEAYAQDKVKEMISTAKVVREKPLDGGGVEVTVEMQLFGGFAQLMLPPDVRQVEPIKPLVDPKMGDDQRIRTDSLTQNASRARPNSAYTGLLVDARGIGASPSMVPMIFNENGQEVYGPAYVSREFAVQHGMCRYIRGAMDGAAVLPQVAPNPLIVKGLRTVTEGSCDIVISNADASILRGTSSHLEFLKQCRVVIVLD